MKKSVLRLTAIIVTTLTSSITGDAADYDRGISRDVSDSWEAAGHALVSDGWFSPLITDGQTAPYEVELQMHTTRQGIYRLINPFTNTNAYAPAIADLSVNDTSDRYMEVDVSNPECVVIPLFNTGIKADGREIIAGNTAGYYMTTYGYDTATFERYAMANLGTAFIDRYENGKVTVRLSCHTFADRPAEFTAWPGTTAAQSVIEFVNDALISPVIPDDERPEYFTLQGIALSTPPCGQPVICRTSRGTYVTVIYR